MPPALIIIIIILLLCAACALTFPSLRRRIFKPRASVPTIGQPTPAPVATTHTDPAIQDAVIMAQFDFRSARTHVHGPLASETMIFLDRKLVNDPANNPGHIFLGNSLLVQNAAGVKRLLWWDSAADIGRATQLLAVSMSGRSVPLEVTYDPACGMIIDVRLT